MSLLMDALKRAETAKQEAARAQFGIAPATSPESTLSLEPLGGDTGSAATNPLPDLANYIDAVDADLASTPLPRTPASPTQNAAAQAPASQAADQAKRDTARNAFAAKQMPAATPPSRLPLWLALGTLGIAGIGIGGYVWYELNSLNRGSMANSAPFASPPPAPALPVPAPAATVPQVQTTTRAEEPVLFAPRQEAPPEIGRAHV